MKAASVSLTRVLANLLESMPPLRLYANVACWANCVESVSIISATRWDCRSTGQENFLEIWESTLTTTLLSSIYLFYYYSDFQNHSHQTRTTTQLKFFTKVSSLVDFVWPPSVFLSCADRTCCLDQRVLQQQPTSLCYFQQNLLVQQQQQSPREALT